MKGGIHISKALEDIRRQTNKILIAIQDKERRGDREQLLVIEGHFNDIAKIAIYEQSEIQRTIKDLDEEER
jgi:hypothetical protein